MICRYCGNVVDADATVCPHCSSPLVGYNAPTDYEESPSYEQPEYSYEDSYEDSEQDIFDEEAGYAKSKKKLNVSMPNLSLSTLLALASAIFSLVCLFSVSSMKADVADSLSKISAGVSQVQAASASVQDRLGSMESTIANVQTSAYEQLASQNITITKDITSLVGPVSLGKYNQMFIVKANGALNLSTSFDWQKYNDATGGWVSIVFTGTATSNDEFGLRLENRTEEGEYVSILWANGITEAGAGTYRCVITDNTGVKKTSSEAIVQVTAA